MTEQKAETKIEGFDAASKTFEQITQQMKDAPQIFNALIVGDKGSGKTTLASTARKPILIHSFDPGGGRSIRDQISEGGIFIDSTFEKEVQSRPTAYATWQKEFKRMEKEKVFDNLGTYVIDSVTTWYQALYNYAGTTLGKDGYKLWATIADTIADTIARCQAAPCDFLMLAHIDYEKDETLGGLLAKVMIGGSMGRKLPIFFDELYFMIAKPGAVTEYIVLTQRSGLLKPSTRLGSGGRFKKEEEPNIKNLLKKAGYSTEDKPYLKREKQEETKKENTND